MGFIMGQIVPDQVERYLAGLNHLADPVLQEIAQTGEQEDLPLIDAEVGALLRVLATAIGATRVLEIGTAIGYSGIWLAGALPAGGMLVTLEMDEDRVRRARANFARAGLSDRVNVVIGDAARMLAKVSGPFDLVFQDGDKQLYVPLLDRLVALLRPGGLLVTDNVLWDGEVVPGYKKPTRPAADTRAIAEYNERLNAHPQLMTTTVPLRDGVAIAVKRGSSELQPLLRTLAGVTNSLREADFNDDAQR
jgi:predicted O-methyltransferase YrrM